ncbi:helix-turn-helix transcriptional regulator [Streptomyces sp. MI02-7b]|uniref:helix-turn-helix domain-containing protein n=1 Tax=Streptomyces sp. MI02-7b TaxID=462941 RepID=UPI0029CA0ACF|nr:helix-turn-helix transcriptional regulator [Streptomyces sp. MI02-7b]
MIQKCTVECTDFQLTPREFGRVPPTSRPSDRVIARRRAIGDHIRDARRSRNMTQESLGERAGVDRQAISLIENGHASPLLDTLIAIADALGVPLAHLVRD